MNIAVLNLTIGILNSGLLILILIKSKKHAGYNAPQHRKKSPGSIPNMIAKALLNLKNARDNENKWL